MPQSSPYRTAPLPVELEREHHFTASLTTPLSTNNNAFSLALTVGPERIGIFQLVVFCVGQGPLEVRARLKGPDGPSGHTPSVAVLLPHDYTQKYHLRGQGPIELLFRSTILGEMVHLNGLSVNSTFTPYEPARWGVPQPGKILSTPKPADRWSTLMSDDELQLPDEG